MDQDNTKPGPGDIKGSWRDRLGISRELPKISDEFKQPQAQPSSDRLEPPPGKTASPRPGMPVAKPAPMAPRPNTNELGERLRKQREAAERMAEQRVAEAKNRALEEQRPAPSPGPGTGAPPRPRFSFADNDQRQATHEPPAPRDPGRRQWNQTTGAAGAARPVFTADRHSTADPRSRGPAPAPRQTSSAPPSYARPQATPPQRVSPPNPQGYAPPGASERQWQARPQRQGPPPGYDPYRRDMAGEPYAGGDPYRRSQSAPEQARRYNDYRNAHPRDLDYVEEGPDDLFEEDQNYSPQPRRRATSQEYAQAYRDYEGGHEEQEQRRRTGPFLLVGALILAGLVASGLVYYYKSGTDAAKTATEGNVPVVAEPTEPVKTQPETSAAAEDESVPSTEQQSSMAPATERPSPGAKKQIYDRILGETTLEEQEQVVPSEEEPVEPEGNAQGFDSDPLPLPLPPSPGGSSDDQSGSLDAPSGPQTTAAVSKSAAENSSQQASPAAASLPDQSSTTTEPAQRPAQTADAAQPIEQTVEPAAPAPPVTAEQKIDSELAFTEQPSIAGAAAAGPVQIAQLPGLSGASTVAPQALPDIAEGSTAGKRKAFGRATDKVILNSNRNFNKARSVEVAQIEPQPLTTQSTTEAAPPSAAQPQPAPQQQAALIAPKPQASQTAIPQRPLSGFVIQLASYKTEADALAGYDMLRQQHASIVGSLTPNIEKTDVGAGGTFYRLHLGSFPSRQAAKSVCSNLLAAGERDCIVKTR
jgi:cell division septation protein DedD